MSKLRILVDSMRAAWWALLATLRLRLRLRRSGLERCSVPGPPALRAEARRGVHAALKVLRGTCLERAIVLQRWLGARGDARDVVIGVAGSMGTFRAHAWVDGEPDALRSEFAEITRFRP